MKRNFSVLFARAICHATEDLDKVKLAMANTIGDRDLKVSATEGHHGNPITVVEGSVKDADGISEFFERLGEGDLRGLLDSLNLRLDDSCNLFLRVDKQAACLGEVKLSPGEDVVSVRVRVSAFPARREIAEEVVREFVESLLSGRGQARPAP